MPNILRLGPNGQLITDLSTDPLPEPKTPESVPAAPADDFGRIAAAEVNARFGTTRAKVPDLLGDWKKATVDAAIEDAARATFWPEVEQALADAEQQKGAPLNRREAHHIVHVIEQARMPAAIPLVAPAIEKNATTRQQAIDDSLQTYRPIVAQKKDPFMPLALGDPNARAKERVLWENPRVMVLVDAFCDKPKALVVPKTPVSFPVDATKKQLDELAKIAAETSAAFAQVKGCKDAEIWVNPPQYLSVKQLHVHVGPPLPEWDDSLDEQTLEKEQNTLWTALTAVLSQRLKHY